MESHYSEDCIDFINRSPSPYHVVENIERVLSEKGFVSWRPGDDLSHGKGYFTNIAGTTSLSFVLGKNIDSNAKFRIICAHSDSPCLKIKPSSKKDDKGYDLLGISTYGSGLWHTWFDRDLGLAGKVAYYDEEKDCVSSKLVNIKRPIMNIPNLAIHLTNRAEDDFKFDKEINLVPVVGLTSLYSDKSFRVHRHHKSMMELIASDAGISCTESLDMDLCLYDVNKGAIGGLENDFIYSSRLDNLLMTYCALKTIEEADVADNTIALVVVFNHEEIGSESSTGADSILLKSLIEAILQKLSIANVYLPEAGFIISADCSHAVHPNYGDRHEDNHKPILNGGIVIKYDVNQRYATTCRSSMVIQRLASKKRLKIQKFCVKNTSRCGSTVGPMLSSLTGMETVDLGLSILGMHSIRETGGSRDICDAITLFKEFFHCTGIL